MRALYRALAARDGEAMAACYTVDATFEDPVFGELRGADVGAMWRLLCRSARGLEVRLVDVHAAGDSVRARVEASYDFSRAHRRVHNVIDARFALRDGLITRHEDVFDLWRWSRMALGPTGLLLGWTPFVKRRVREDALRRLAKSKA